MDQTVIQSLQDQITNLQSQIDALKSTTTIPFEIGEAMKERVSAGFLTATVIPGSPAPMTVTDTNGGNPPVNYSVAAPFTKQIKVILGGVSYVIPVV